MSEPKPGKARPRALDRVETKLAKACGQFLSIEQEMHWDTVDEIVAWEKDHPGWGAELRRHYLSDRVLGPYLFMLAQNDPLDGASGGHNSQLTNDDRKLIFDHLPLFRRLAADRATSIDGVFGETSINGDVFCQLEAIGLEVFEEQVARFDPTRGVTFGAFVEKRLAGAMDNWLTRERVKTAWSARAARSIWFANSNANAPKRHRASTGGYRQRSYIESSARPVARPRGVSLSASYQRIYRSGWRSTLRLRVSPNGSAWCTGGAPCPTPRCPGRAGAPTWR